MKYGRYTIRKNNGLMQYPYTVLVRGEAIDNCNTMLGVMTIIMRHRNMLKKK